MEIEPHSTFKNRALGLYYRIFIEIVKKRNKLYYVDLFSGDGENICPKTDNMLRPAPFITQFLEKAKNNEINVSCYLNDIDPANCEKLKEKTKQYKKFIIDITNEDANIIYKNILQDIPTNELSLFFLDPSKHTDLDIKTIEEISKHEEYDPISNCKRRPELIINLMTYTMQRNARINTKSVIKAIGDGEWVEAVRNKQIDEKTYRILHDAFIKRLETFGYFTTSIEVRQTHPLNSVLYYLIFASSIPRAHEIQEKFKKEIKIRYEKKWRDNNYCLKLISEAKEQGIRPLTDFLPKN